MFRLPLLAVLSTYCFLFAAPLAAAAPTSRKCEVAKYFKKPRIFITSDMGNEPDDQMSLVRLLTYANELRIEGLAATTSSSLPNKTYENLIYEVLDAYGQVVDNLNSHVPSAGLYPSVEYLKSVVSTSKPLYGMEAIGGPLSSAGTTLIKSVDASDEPLWVPIWGGSLVAAEALYYIRQTRSQMDVDKFISKLRIYAISDQDDTGAWIRQNFPKLFYIVSIHGFWNFKLATWAAISGELQNNFDIGGPNSTLVSQDWLRANIQSKGALGAAYPDIAAIMEGDTASFLYLIPNGLGDPEMPHYGSWGGRYAAVDPAGFINTYSDVADTTVGVNGMNFTSNHATVWRWRQAYQNDFAARMDWTILTPSEANHQPVAVVNDTCGATPLHLNFTAGENITLDASASWDPDQGDSLSFDWLFYKDLSRVLGLISARFPNPLSMIALNREKSQILLTPRLDIEYHIVLTVSDSKHLVAYKRIILHPTNPVAWGT